MSLHKSFVILKFAVSVIPLRAVSRFFYAPQHRCFVVADNEYAASSRRAGARKKCTLWPVQLLFLGLRLKARPPDPV
jgi:hypothetical protein